MVQHIHIVRQSEKLYLFESKNSHKIQQPVIEFHYLHSLVELCKNFPNWSQ